MSYIYLYGENNRSFVLQFGWAQKHSVMQTKSRASMDGALSMDAPWQPAPSRRFQPLIVGQGSEWGASCEKGHCK